MQHIVRELNLIWRGNIKTFGIEILLYVLIKVVTLLSTRLSVCVPQFQISYSYHIFHLPCSQTSLSFPVP